jgi:hypothetical protein
MKRCLIMLLIGMALLQGCTSYPRPPAAAACTKHISVQVTEDQGFIVNGSKLTMEESF